MRDRLPKCLRLRLPKLLQNHIKDAPCFLLRVSMLLQSFFELFLISFDFFNRFLQAVNPWIRDHWSFSLIFCLLGLIFRFLQSFFKCINHSSFNFLSPLFLNSSYPLLSAFLQPSSFLFQNYNSHSFFFLLFFPTSISSIVSGSIS